MRPAVLRPLILLAVAIPVAAADSVMRARHVSSDGLPAGAFDAQWVLPSQRIPARDRRPPNHVDLLHEMKALAKMTFPLQEGERELPWTRSFGDLVRGLREARGDPERRSRMLAILRECRPSVWKAVGEYLPQLAADDALYAADWDPDDDEDDDGMLLVSPFDRTSADRAPWNGVDGTTDVHQAATLVYADMDAILGAENDFTAAEGYEEVWGIEGSFLRGDDEGGRPFAVVRTWFKTDLTFPYGTCASELHVRTTLDDDGHVRTDMYGSGHDFYWLAGQDVAIPVFASDGEFVALLLTRAYGLDIRGVPDGDGARRSTLRDMLGTLRLRAERSYAAHGGKPRTVSGGIPEFVVRGIGPGPREE